MSLGGDFEASKANWVHTVLVSSAPCCGSRRELSAPSQLRPACLPPAVPAIVDPNLGGHKPKCSVLNHSNRAVAEVFHKKCPSQMQSLERLVVSGDAQALLVEVCHWGQDLSVHSLALLQFPCHWNVPAALPHCCDEFLPLQNHKRKQNFHNESCFGSWSLDVATESNW